MVQSQNNSNNNSDNNPQGQEMMELYPAGSVSIKKWMWRHPKPIPETKEFRVGVQ